MDENTQLEWEEFNEDDFFNDLMSEIMHTDDITDDGNDDSVNVEDSSAVEIKDNIDSMSNAIVTQDGRTLEDMLPGLGSRRKRGILANLVTEDKVDVDVSNKYTKHVEVIDKETADNEKRVALSMKFIQRNAEYTEQEKIIMRNLGLTNNELSDTMRSKDLSIKQKEEVLGLGRYGAEKHFKGRRYRTSVGDTAMLEFLVKFKFANTRILRWISNEPQGRTWRKLNRMRDSGLVESKTIIGVPDLWGATNPGVALSGYNLKPGLKPMPKIPTISNDMGVNYVAACLWFNSVNVLNLEDFPANNKVISTQEDGRDRVRGEMLVSQLEIRSSIGREISPVSTTMESYGGLSLYDTIADNARESLSGWRSEGMNGDSPEFHLGNEFMWALFPTLGLTSAYHIPDLVVRRDHGPNGEPRSIAVEVERHEKSNDKYDDVMLSYKLDDHLYGHVIWLTSSTRIARRLAKAANSVGLDNYTIMPIMTEDGTPYEKQDIWMI